MSKSFTATWLGDGDPAAQMVRMGDLAFVKGEKVTVKEGHPFYDQIKDNPTFSTEAKAEVVPAVEPTEDELEARSEEGTEKGAIKAQLRGMGVDVKGNPSLDTLRNKLVEASKPKG